MEELICDICGKQCKTEQGLAGHKQLAHSRAELGLSRSPELALAEMLGAVKEGYDRLNERLERFTSDAGGLRAQLTALDEKLDSFQSGFESAGGARVAELERENNRLRDKADYFDQLGNLADTPEGLADLAKHLGSLKNPEDFVTFALELGYLAQLPEASKEEVEALEARQKAEASEALPSVLNKITELELVTEKPADPENWKYYEHIGIWVGKPGYRYLEHLNIWIPIKKASEAEGS